MELYHEQIEEKIVDMLPSFGPKSRLSDACAYALTNGGKRLRPSFVYQIADQIGKGIDVTDAALAVELFHTASLIADDLPCMDDDDMRRGRLSLHKAFDEATAILTTYALIAEGYERIRLASKGRDPEICQLALQLATANTGIHGATGGQYLDLHEPENLLSVIEKKTGTLFEIAFAFGWLFGGGEVEKLETIKKAARNFGLAFQIQDDLLDVKQDDQEKNYALLYGEKNARQTLDRTLTRLQELLNEVNLSLKKPILMAGVPAMPK
ncbi:MAG: hypothetical protein S4CHLAM45_10830 [Chlamydiales bacterium]|nr:hypothetical protein [Chlamydiales bacterium]MCH9619575.1 hypothetical protein [Chlamydiales bacterium]MCH9623181.1 hypothetical protein [Chlamydiales bacterium]